MGFDLNMLEPPTAAEVKAAHLPAEDSGYFRFNWSGMPVMVTVMVAAGAMTDDEPAVRIPDVPPTGLDPARTELITQAFTDRDVETKLTPPERTFLHAYHALIDQLWRAQSKHPGVVPAFKFQSNSGFIVTPPECAMIATKIRGYAGQLTQTKLDELDKQYREGHAAMDKQLRQQQPGEVNLMADEGLGMTLADAREWIEDWAMYNQIAAKHGGYQIF